MRSLLLCSMLASAVTLAFPVEAAPLVAREPFARAHVTLMARAQKGNQPAKMADVDIWAGGTRLKAAVAGDPERAQWWIDGLDAEPLRLVQGKSEDAKARSLAQGLSLALRATPELANRQNDRVAGKPCKVVVEALPGGYSLRRCFWRGLPLSVELSGHGFEFNLAATLVEENRVTVADLQPPPGAPAAPKSMNAAR